MWVQTTLGIYFDVVSPQDLIDLVQDMTELHDTVRGGILFNRPNFHTQPYGVKLEHHVVQGHSQLESNGCISLGTHDSGYEEQDPFFVITKNLHKCPYGLVSEKARELGASVLVIAAQSDEDMQGYIDYDTTLETIPTIITHSSFVNVTLDNWSDDEQHIFVADYTFKIMCDASEPDCVSLNDSTQVKYSFLMSVSGEIDVVIADFLRNYTDFLEIHDLFYAVLTNHEDCQAADFLDGTTYWRHSEFGVDGQLILKEIIRQYCFWCALNNLYQDNPSLAISHFAFYINRFWTECAYSEACIMQQITDYYPQSFQNEFDEWVENQIWKGQSKNFIDSFASKTHEQNLGEVQHIYTVIDQNGELFAGRDLDLVRPICAYWSTLPGSACREYIWNSECFKGLQNTAVCVPQCDVEACDSVNLFWDEYQHGRNCYLSNGDFWGSDYLSTIGKWAYRQETSNYCCENGWCCLQFDEDLQHPDNVETGDGSVLNEDEDPQHSDNNETGDGSVLNEDDETHGTSSQNYSPDGSENGQSYDTEVYYDYHDDDDESDGLTFDELIEIVIIVLVVLFWGIPALGLLCGCVCACIGKFGNGSSSSRIPANQSSGSESSRPNSPSSEDENCRKCGFKHKRANCPHARNSDFPNSERYTMYHGTSHQNADSIEKEGFRPSTGGMLGSGVYLSRDITKAESYGQVVFECLVDVGRVKRIDRQGHTLQKSWSQNGYDSAWVPPNCGMVDSGKTENCIKSPDQIQILRRARG